jgi:hypothetical protein
VTNTRPMHVANKVKIKSCQLMALLMCWASPLFATILPATTTDTFCADVQKILAGTELESILTVYPDVASYRKSKLTAPPLTSSQFVALDDRGRPKMVSCKVKSADHIRDEYGEDAAGEQRPCRDITLMVQGNVARKLESEDPTLAETVRFYVIEPDEPFTTGSAYLTPFPLTFQGADGALHIHTQSLQIDWLNYKWILMPYILRGQTYCHLITPEHMEALARGEAQPDDPADYPDSLR